MYNKFPPRSLVENVQTHIMGEPLGGDSDSHLPGDPVEERRKEIAKVVELRKTLDNHLNHMARYLGLDADGRQPEVFRSSVLHRVRDTLAWKEQSLSSQQLDERIQEVSAFMFESLWAHALIS